jgi:hypothetical protein
MIIATQPLTHVYLGLLLLRPALVSYLNNRAPLNGDRNPADIGLLSVILLENVH